MKKLTKILGLLFAIIIGITLSFLLISKESHFDYEIDPKYYSENQSPFENDFDYAFDTLEKYYALFYRNGTYDFLKNRDSYKKEIKNLKTDKEFFDKMNRILEDLGDGHTNLLDNDESYDMKETFVLSNKEEKGLVNVDLINYLFGTKISSNEIINKIFKESRAATKNLITQDINKDIAYLKIRAMIDPGTPDFEEDLDLLKTYLKKSKNKKALIIDLRGNGGGNSAYTNFYLYPMILGKKDFKDTHEYILFRSDEVFKYDPQYPELRDSIKKIKDSDFKYLEENIPFLKKDKKMMDDIRKNYTHIIFNPGLENPCEFGDEYKFNGNLYLLIDEDVYSSGQIAAHFFRDNDLGTIIGEKTGGDGIGTTPAMVKLPNTKYILRFSHELGLRETESMEESTYTIPDIEIPRKDQSQIPSNDGCVKKVIELEGQSK
ncbi:S41 family peptidase [uncultured Anaerococcus sp.]|uniref:S41 family peptidase n=1 Tax=uncultured Anaerococcus sp. TaxID=293428 RepID=UPI00288AB47D|nr:S41 family peptidase [uncultured Anaerococcus sp.]